MVRSIYQIFFNVFLRGGKYTVYVLFVAANYFADRSIIGDFVDIFHQKVRIVTGSEDFKRVDDDIDTEFNERKELLVVIYT